MEIVYLDNGRARERNATGRRVQRDRGHTSGRFETRLLFRSLKSSNSQISNLESDPT